MITLQNKLASHYPAHPSGIIELLVSDVDAEWIASLPIQLGANGHPMVPIHLDKPSAEACSLARMIMRRHGIPVPDHIKVLRKDTLSPHDLTHENLCVPACIVEKFSGCSEPRSISLHDFASVFSITRPTEPEEDPVFIPCVDVDTAKLVLLVGDQDDYDWLAGKPIRFNNKGFPMIQIDWGKWTPLMFEQARRSGIAEDVHATILHIKPAEPMDIRKYYIAALTKTTLKTIN